MKIDNAFQEENDMSFRWLLDHIEEAEEYYAIPGKKEEYLDKIRAQMGGEGLCGDRDGLCFCSRKAGHKGPHHGDSIRVEWCALGGNEDSVWY